MTMTTDPRERLVVAGSAVLEAVMMRETIEAMSGARGPALPGEAAAN